MLVGDPEQLQAIEAGAAFRSLTEAHGAVEITEIRRQRDDWQRGATRALATGRTGEAIHAYGEHGMVHSAETREEARAELVEGWDQARTNDPAKSRIILTHTNAEVRELNIAAREKLRDGGELRRLRTVASSVMCVDCGFANIIAINGLQLPSSGPRKLCRFFISTSYWGASLVHQ